jgi:uncharacterized membrane protein
VTDEPIYRRRAVRPGECLRAGWHLVRDDFWLFVGVCFVGTLLASLAPFGILAGPMLCGIYICLLRRDRGKAVKFEMLFDGFRYFLQSLIATVIMLLPLVAIVVPGYLLVVALVMHKVPLQPGAQMSPDEVWTLVGAFGSLYLVAFVVWITTTTLFVFTYPLIVDRGMTGFRAVATSCRAALANFGRVLALVLLIALLNLGGSLVCCVGFYLVVPVHYAAVLVAYRQAFPEVEEPPADPEEADLGPIEDLGP